MRSKSPCHPECTHCGPSGVHIRGPIMLSHDVAKRVGVTPAAVRMARRKRWLDPIAHTASGEALYDLSAVREYKRLRDAWQRGRSFLVPRQLRLWGEAVGVG